MEKTMLELANTFNIDPKMANILIVDDEYANVRLLEKILSLLNYQNLTTTQDPTEVLPLYEKHQFDLILLDINMPVLDGYGVMKQLNELTDNKPPPILVLTAQNMQSYRQQALDSGALDYVTKPFDRDELLSRVRNLLDVQMAHKFMRYQNEILEQRVQERTEELVDTRLQIVHHLGRAAEYRDNETGLHIIRMSKISVVLARAAGISEHDCDLLLNAAPMHDIGKIGIPDRILLKPGKLDEEEWKIMKTHPIIGADVLSGGDSELLNMAQEIAISHHEKWNGKGYPHSLKGEDIPLVGRICAIADVFDALNTERPYKKAWPLDKTLDLIKQESGEHFEPRLVDLLFQELEKVLAISQKYTEPAVKGNAAP